MSSRQMDMFERPSRAKSRVLMQAVDHGYADGAGRISHFICKRCGHDAGWCTRTEREARRGAPCPRCNDADETEGAKVGSSNVLDSGLEQRIQAILASRRAANASGQAGEDIENIRAAILDEASKP